MSGSARSKISLIVSFTMISIVISVIHADRQHSLLTSEYLKRSFQSSSIPVRQSILRQLDVLTQQSSGNISMSAYYQHIKSELIITTLGPAYQISRKPYISGTTNTGTVPHTLPIIQPPRVCGIRVYHPIDYTGSLSQMPISQLFKLLGGDSDRDMICLSVAAGITSYDGGSAQHLRMKNFLIQLIKLQESQQLPQSQTTANSSANLKKNQ